MKKGIAILMLSLMPLLALSQEKVKLMASSQDERPGWLADGRYHDAYMIQANRMPTLEDAQKSVLASLLENIASSVAVQVTGKVEVEADELTAGEQNVFAEKIQSTSTTEIAEMPMLKGISISKAKVYWEKYYDKKNSETYYDYYILYPFSSYDLQKLIDEYNEFLNTPQYPSEWGSYTAAGYMFDIQEAKKNTGMSDTELANRLLDIARANLAKQIQVKLRDNGTMNRLTDRIYQSSISSETDVDISLLETRSYFNPAVNKTFAIAFVNKQEALRFYERQIDVVFGTVEKHITVTDTYVEMGFKTKAKDEIKKATAEFAKLDKPIFFLTVFDIPEYRLQDILKRHSDLETAVTRKIADLEYGTNIYVECVANMFGQTYPNISKELKAKLSEMGCNFTDDRAAADWAVIIKANSREYNSVDFGGSVNYFSYVDAEISLEKVVTNQRIYEDMITEKGGHTRDFNEAARVAYKKITPKIIELVTGNIKQ